MNINNPKYKLWEKVGYEGEIWEICGFCAKFGYIGIDWNYYLKELDCNGERTALRNSVPEIKLETPESVLKEKIKKSQLELKNIEELAMKSKISMSKLKE